MQKAHFDRRSEVIARFVSFACVAVLSVVLIEAGIQPASGAAKVATPAPRFTAVKFTKAPTIDGKIEASEWDGALTTSAIIAAFDHKLLTSSTTMSMGFDDSRFYFMFRCRRADAEWNLTKSVRVNDDYSFGDPSVEVWVAPPKAVPETYQSVINTYPAVLDLHMIPSRGYTAQGWKGNWIIGAREDADEYIIEASVPMSDFGVQSVKNGEVWRFLLCRSALGAWPRFQGSWALTTGFAEIPQYPDVVLNQDDVVVRATDAHTILSGRYKLPVALVAPKSRNEEVSVELRWHKIASIGDPTDIVETKNVKLAAGSSQTLEFAGDVPAEWLSKVTVNKVQKEVPTGHATLTVKRAGAAADDVIFRQTVPYNATGWVPTRPVKPATTPDAPPVSVMARYGPQSNTLLLRTDIFNLPERARIVGGRARLYDPAQPGKDLLVKPIPGFIEFYSDAHFKLDGVEVPLQDHRKQDEVYAEIRRIRNENEDRAKKKKELASRKPKPGEAPIDLDKDPTVQPLPVPVAPAWTEPRKLVVEVSVTDDSGKTLASSTQEVKLLRHQFQWQNNTIGVSDEVLPPWSPVKFDTSGAEVWNRKLKLDGLAMLSKVSNGGTDQLRSMRIVAIQDGKPVVIKTSEPKLQKLTPAAATFTGTGSGAGLELSASNRLEFDGFTLSDLTIAPAKKEAVIDGLFLEVVLPESEATHFCASAGLWSAVHDETPAYWSSQQTSSGMMIGDFVPYIWLTNSDRGFLWVADNDKGWITEDKKARPTQEIIRKDGTVTLRIHFIEVPAKLSAPTTLRYAYQTFPARPVPVGWRSWVCGGAKAVDFPSARHTYFFPDFDSDWAVLWPYFSSPFAWSWERTRRWMERFTAVPNHRPTVGGIAHSIGRYQDYEGRQFPDFSVDWGDTPGVIGNSSVTQSQGPIDFRIFNYERWIREGKLRALYFDENYIGFDRNFLTGGAYVRPDGRIQPGYTYIGLRDFFKRLNYTFHAAGAAKPNIWLHTTSGSAFHAWLGDILMEGENVSPTDLKFDYLEVLPAARMRAIGSAQAAGSAMLMMCQPTRSGTPFTAKHIHQFIGWVQAHDILPEQIDWFNPIAQSAQYYRDDLKFRGYWHADVPAKTATPEAIVSVHHTKGPPSRALLWIVNTARKEQSVNVAIDFKAMGLDPSKVIALDAETGGEIPLSGNGLSVRVIDRDFVAVHLIQPRLLKSGESFAADFNQSLEANESLGAMVLEDAAERIEDGTGHALSLVKPVTLLPNLILQNESGKISFRTRLTGRTGVILRSSSRGPRRGESVLPPGLVIEAKRTGKGEDVTLTLRRDVKDGPTTAASTAVAPGWHTVSIAWNAGVVTLALDGNSVGTIDVDTMNLPASRGPEILRLARFVFSPGPADALDDIKVWRQAP
jgi:hypothetical protein